MLNDLNSKQYELANYMSELSEIEYSAGWMKDLEFNLWQLMKRRINQYGRLSITEEIILKLESMSSEIDGWIYFDDLQEETFISLENWKKKIKDYH